MESDEALVRLAELDAEYEELLAAAVPGLRTSERLAVLDRLEARRRRQPVIEHTILSRLVAETSPAELGAKSWGEVLSRRLRISVDEARRRVQDAADLGPRQALSGQPLAPHWPTTAAAQAHGQVGAEHIAVIRKFFAELPDHVERAERERAEQALAGFAARLRPEELRKLAHRLAQHLNPDGVFSDRDRARKRCLRIGRQGVDGMSEIRGWLDPEARATLDAVLAKLAAPGMCNPDGDSPCVDGEPAEEVKRRDTRTPAQRNHDALTAMGKALLASGQLGQHRGLPATLVITTTLGELESGAGQAVTAGGSLLPMRDVIRLAAQSHHYLAVFDDHTREPLYLGRAKRLATQGQRLVLYARDRGCTHPGCTVPAYWTEVHHTQGWATNNGHTNADTMALACKGDHRLADRGWQTRQRHDGRTEWLPPPHLDTGQARVNDYHHPERLLGEPEPDEDDG